MTTDGILRKSGVKCIRCKDNLKVGELVTNEYGFHSHLKHREEAIAQANNSVSNA